MTEGVVIFHERVARRGVSIVEAMIATLLVSSMFIASMQAVSTSAIVRFKAADRSRGHALATALLDEIVQQDYVAPSVAKPGVPIYGSIAGGGAGGSSRLSFDDIDDYHNYTDSPPLNRDGTAIPSASAYVRKVTVVKVNPANLAQTSAAETGAKLITVTVTRNGLTVSKQAAVRTAAP